MPQWCIPEVSSAAHAELFLGHFKVAELGFMGVRTINGLGEFVNAPHNRCACIIVLQDRSITAIPVSRPSLRI